MSLSFYVYDGINERGPFTTTELVNQSRSGELAITHKVRRSNSQNWVVASKVRGLAFPQNAEDSRLIASFQSLTKRMTEIILKHPVNSELRSQAACFVETHCCDSTLLFAMSTESNEELHSAISLSLGHDIVYLSIVAILADGRVDSDELATISGLMQTIASLFARNFVAYRQFDDMSQNEVEKFLVAFKKERPHYKWPSKQDPTAFSPDVMTGAYAALAAEYCDPSGKCAHYYQRVIRAIVDCIVRIGGITPEELAFTSRLERYFDQLNATLAQFQRPQTKKSELLGSSLESNFDSGPGSTPESFHFRKISWGMTREEVKARETAEICLETDSALFYNAKVSDLESLVVYIFAQGICVRAKYSIQEAYSNLNTHLTDYQKIRDLLCKKYAPVPRQEDWDADMFWRNDLYEDDCQEWGFAVSIGHLALLAKWHTEDTDIALVLCGENYEVTHAVEYSSRKLAHLEEETQERTHLEDL